MRYDHRHGVFRRRALTVFATTLSYGMLLAVFFMGSLLLGWFRSSTTVAAINMTFVVTTAADSGPGSLRQAITDSNAAVTTSANPNAISFTIPGAGVHTIALQTPLPQIAQPTVIDGTTQPGTSCGNLVADAPFGAGSAHSLAIEIVSTPATALDQRGIIDFGVNTDNSAVRGLVVHGTTNGDAYNIRFNSPGMVVECNYLGTLPDATQPSITDGSQPNIWSMAAGPAADNATITNNVFGAGRAIQASGKPGDMIDGWILKNNLFNVSPDGSSIGSQNLGPFFGYFSNLTVGGSLSDANVFAGTRGAGLEMQESTAVTIANNYVGVTPSNQALSNAYSGISTFNTSDVVIRGNYISSNTNVGLNIVATSKIKIVGNYIGSGIDGNTSGVGNGQGIRFSGDNSDITIGGANLSERNIISGNVGAGTAGQYTTYSGTNKIQGNYFGLGANGRSLANGDIAISLNPAGGWLVGGSNAGEGNIIGKNGRALSIENNSTGLTTYVYGNIIGLEADGETSAKNTQDTTIGLSGSAPIVFGGSSAGQGNLVANVHGSGISFGGTGLKTIRGNTFGLTKSGQPAPITWSAIGTWGSADGIVIGGPATADGNVIANAGNYGIDFAGTVTNATIQNNTIYGGASQPATGTIGGGIYLSATSTGNMISHNTIRDNTSAGVVAGGYTATNTSNTIRQNSIYRNGTIGIDLSNTQDWQPLDGVTLNDPLDADTGPNGLQNYPVITASMTRCDGSVDTKNTPMFNSTPNTTFTIDYYANPSWNPSSTIPRQGEQWVTSETVTTDANGNATLNLTLINSITYPSVTATAPDGSTSEFGSINTVAFTQCKDMLQRTVATTTNDITLSATWTGSQVPATYLRNQPQFPTDYNSTTGQYTDRLEQAGMTFTVTVGGQNFIWQDHPSIFSSSYTLDDNGWSVAGHTATPLPEGTYDVVLTVTDPITKLSMSRTYPGAVKVALPRVSYTTTFTNNSTPTLTGTASGVLPDYSSGLYTAYILPKGSAAPNPNLLSSDPAYVAPRVLQYVADTTKDAAGNTIIADTGAFKVLTNKQAIINAWTAYHDEQLANWAVGGVPEWNYFSNKVHSLKVTNTGGVDWSTIKSVQDIKGTCTNTEVQQAFYNWGWATAATQASCEAGIQAAYDADKSWYDQYLQTNIDNLSSATPDYDTSPLPQGTYDVYILGYDVSSNSFQKDFPGGLVVDFTTPTVTLVTTAAKDNVSPQLNGSVSDPTAAVTVTLTGPNGTTYGPFTAKNNGDGTWTLPAGAIQPGLVLGTYTVAVTVTSLSGNHSTETKTLVLTASTKPTTLSKTGSDYIYVLSISGVVLGVGALWLVGQRRRTEKRLRYVRS